MLQRRSILCLPLALAAAGCTARYRTDTLTGGAVAGLDRRRAVYIAVPQDGAYGGRTANGSGQTVAQVVAAEISRVGPTVHIADRAQATPEALNAAKGQRAGYVVVPVIANWEQRATEWSGRPSRIAIRLTVYDAETGNQIVARAIEGRSRIMSLTSTSPDSLLRSPVRRVVRELYGAPAEPE